MKTFDNDSNKIVEALTHFEDMEFDLGEKSQDMILKYSQKCKQFYLSYDCNYGASNYISVETVLSLIKDVEEER